MRAIEPKLFELDPKSVVKIYEIIGEYVNDSSSLKKKDDLNSIFNDSSKYSLKEKYFLAYYLSNYFNFKNKKSYISRKIKEFEDIEDSGDTRDKEFIDDMKNDAIKINEICNLNLKKFKRRYNSYIASNINLDKVDKTFIHQIRNWKRLPIEKVFREKLIEVINTELSPFYSDETINVIIDNSFEVNAFRSRIKLLNIEFERSSDIYLAFYNIYIEYKKNAHLLKKKSILNNRILDGNYTEEEEDKDRILTEDEKKIRELKRIEQERKDARGKFRLRKQKEEYSQATNRINFAKILFLSFSKIRENYITNQIEINDSVLNKYLESVSKNIKK